MTQNELLVNTLEVAVPLRIFDYKQDDGPSDEDFSRVRAKFESVMHDALFESVKGKTSEAFNALADAIAVLSFCPGGIKLFGRHWEA